MTSPSGSDQTHFDSGQQTRRVLNVKAAVIVLATISAVLVGATLLHGYQHVRTVDYLRESAVLAYDEQRYDDAVQLLESYLTLQSQDSASRDLLLTAIEKADPTTTGMLKRMSIHEEILLEEPDHTELRKQQVQLALRLGRLPDAEAHLNILLEHADSADAELHWLAGQCYEAGENPRKARAAYEAALECDEPYSKAAGCLARILRKEDRDTVAADVVMNRIVQQRQDAEAYALRAEWLLETERPAEAISDLRLALSMTDVNTVPRADAQSDSGSGTETGNGTPDEDRTAWLRLLIKATAAEANLARRRGGTEAARAVLLPTIELLSGDADSGWQTAESALLLASLQWTADEREAATKTLREAVRRFPDHPRTQRMLVDVLLARRMFDDAERTFRTMSFSRMDRADYEFLRARLLMARGHTAEAIQILQVIVDGLALDSALRERAQTALAIASSSTGDMGGAFDEFRLLVQHNPQTERGRLGLAAGYVAQGRRDLAIAEYRQLVHLSDVPPYLAHLLIDHALTLPASVRPWAEIENLLRDEDPPVTDPLQREILRTDMEFARGNISEALRRLETARRAHPKRSEADFAARFLREERTAEVESVLLENIRNEPLEPQRHVELLLFRMVTGRSEEALQWLGSLVNAESTLPLPDADRRRLAVEIACASAAEMKKLGMTSSTAAAVAAIDGLAEAWLKNLSAAASGGNDLLRHAQFLIARDRWLDAFEVVAGASPAVAAEIRGEALLELDRSLRSAVANRIAGDDDTETKKRLASSIGEKLLSLVEAAPKNVTLRLQLAELLIRHNQLDAAEDTYREVLTVFPNHAGAVNNLAWLLSVREKNVGEALVLSEQALRLDADSLIVRETRAAALLAAARPEEALHVLQSVPSDRRHGVSDIREALALFRTGETRAARALLERCRASGTDLGTLTPPDRVFVNSAIEEIGTDDPSI